MFCPINRYGATAQEAGAKFFILDEHGLITKARPNLKEMEENFYDLVSDVTQIQWRHTNLDLFWLSVSGIQIATEYWTGIQLVGQVTWLVD